MRPKLAARDRMWGWLGQNFHVGNLAADLAAVQEIHAVNHLPENGIVTVQMRLARQCNKKLGASGIFARKRHSYGASFVRHKIDLIANKLSGISPAIASRIAALYHKVWDHAMNG